MRSKKERRTRAKRLRGIENAREARLVGAYRSYINAMMWGSAVVSERSQGVVWYRRKS